MEHEWRVPPATCKCPTRDYDWLDCGICGVQRAEAGASWSWLPGREPVPPAWVGRVYCVHCLGNVHADGEVCSKSAVHPTCNYCGGDVHADGKCEQAERLEPPRGDWLTGDPLPRWNPSVKKVTDRVRIVPPVEVVPAFDDAEMIEWQVWADDNIRDDADQKRHNLQVAKNGRVINDWKRFQKWERARKEMGA